jgi:GT2 family glycosyltransferase
MYDLSIITINYNGILDTKELIDSIPIDNKSIEMIVVDNASSNDEASAIQSCYSNIKVIRSNKNLGFAGGNNLGIKASSGKYILLINNDTIIKQFNIEPLINRIQSTPAIGIVCPKICFSYGNNLIQFAGYTPLSKITIRNRAIGCGEEDHGQYDTPHATPYAHGAAMLINRDVIDKVGMMPECYFLYYEELDWSMMVTRAGYEIWYDPSLTVFHKESQSTGQNSPLRTYYITRNRLLLVKRNVAEASKYLSYIYLILIVALRDCIKSVIHGKLDICRATLQGIADFIKM